MLSPVKHSRHVVQELFHCRWLSTGRNMLHISLYIKEGSKKSSTVLRWWQWLSGLTGVLEKLRHCVSETDLMSHKWSALRLDLFLPPGVSEFNPLKKLYLKIQFVPRSKHTPSVSSLLFIKLNAQLNCSKRMLKLTLKFTLKALLHVSV
jgi:hypothetical protein